LNIRISEHQINRKSTNTTVITEHRLRHNHDWLNVKILDSERFFWKRIISEMLNIQLPNNGLNYQTDTENTHIYINFKQILHTLILRIFFFMLFLYTVIILIFYCNLFLYDYLFNIALL